MNVSEMLQTRQIDYRYCPKCGAWRYFEIMRAGRAGAVCDGCKARADKLAESAAPSCPGCADSPCDGHGRFDGGRSCRWCQESGYCPTSERPTGLIDWPAIS